MSTRIENEDFLNKFKNATMEVIGKAEDLLPTVKKAMKNGIVGLMMASSLAGSITPAFAADLSNVSPQNAEIQVDQETQNLQDFVKEFQLSYTEGTQKDIIDIGYTIGQATGADTSDVRKVVKLTEGFYQNFLNDNGISQRDYDMDAFVNNVKEGNAVIEAPHFLSRAVSSPLKSYDEMTPLEANTVIAKAEILTEQLDKKPYSSPEEAVNFMQKTYLKGVRWDGGVWTGQDIEFSKSAIENGFKDFSTSGITQESIDNLPNYLTSYDSDKNIASVNYSGILSDIISETKYTDDSSKEKLAEQSNILEPSVKTTNRNTPNC